MFRNIGWGEILIVLAIAMVLFGATKLPQMAHSLGKSLTSFKKGLKDTADDVKDAIKEEVSEDAEAQAANDAKSSEETAKSSKDR